MKQRSSVHALAWTSGSMVLASVVLVTACNRDRQEQGVAPMGEERRAAEQQVPPGEAAGARVEGDREDMAEDRADAQEILNSANSAVQQLSRGEHGATYRDHVSKAKGVFIFPNVVKAAFGVGGRGGQGVLLARNPDGSFGNPVFFYMGGASVGAQLGVERSNVTLFIMNQDTLNRVADGTVTLGADASVAIGTGPDTSAAEQGVANPDIVSLVEDDGAFIGASLQGAVLQPNADHNAAYYGREAAPRTLLYQPAKGKASALGKTLSQIKPGK